jgi:hypothetical protein
MTVTSQTVLTWGAMSGAESTPPRAVPSLSGAAHGGGGAKDQVSMMSASGASAPSAASASASGTAAAFPARAARVAALAQGPSGGGAAVTPGGALLAWDAAPSTLPGGVPVPLDLGSSAKVAAKVAGVVAAGRVAWVARIGTGSGTAGAAAAVHGSEEDGEEDGLAHGRQSYGDYQVAVGRAHGLVLAVEEGEVFGWGIGDAEGGSFAERAVGGSLSLSLVDFFFFFFFFFFFDHHVNPVIFVFFFVFGPPLLPYQSRTRHPRMLVLFFYA